MDVHQRQATIIAATDFRYGGRTYRPGDKFDWRALLVSERLATQQLDARRTAILTRDSFSTALKRRGAESPPPRGFTIAGLVALGYLTEEEAQERNWIVPEGVKPPSYVPPEGSEQVGDLWVIPVRTAGGPKRFDVVNAEGQRVKEGGTIQGIANATAWAEEFIRQRDLEKGPAPDRYEGMADDELRDVLANRYPFADFNDTSREDMLRIARAEGQENPDFPEAFAAAFEAFHRPPPPPPPELTPDQIAQMEADNAAGAANQAETREGEAPPEEGATDPAAPGGEAPPPPPPGGSIPIPTFPENDMSGLGDDDED